MLGWRIGPHQHVAVHRQPGVHDLLTPVCRHMLGGGCALVRNHRLDLSAKNLLVEPERGLTLPVEVEIWIYMHRTSSLIYICRMRKARIDTKKPGIRD